uniref:Uncharacterized protein n=1 Tax=Triticum urartu TaxID=4572 RepID=A0A8R7UTM3_TRIUA
MSGTPAGDGRPNYIGTTHHSRHLSNVAPATPNLGSRTTSASDRNRTLGQWHEAPERPHLAVARGPRGIHTSSSPTARRRSLSCRRREPPRTTI